jgi:hypothetical protein
MFRTPSLDSSRVKGLGATLVAPICRRPSHIDPLPLDLPPVQVLSLPIGGIKRQYSVTGRLVDRVSRRAIKVHSVQSTDNLHSHAHQLLHNQGSARRIAGLFG